LAVVEFPLLAKSPIFFLNPCSFINLWVVFILGRKERLFRLIKATITFGTATTAFAMKTDKAV